ncbi:MAG: zinc ribbon domain-containing protein [Candidatus Bathyarchaeia archaeon]
MVFCFQCGTQLSPNDHACPKCGAVIPVASSNPTPGVDEVISENKPGPTVQVNSRIPLVEGEELLWHRGSTKGFLHKEVVMEEGVTNKRLVKYDVENKRIIAQLGINHRPEVVVMNIHRVNDSLGGGVFLTPRMFGLGGLGGFGVYGGPRRGNIKVFGDVSFMNEGKVVLSFENVQAPQGLRMLVESLKRQSGFAGPGNRRPLMARRPFRGQPQNPQAKSSSP